MHVQKTVRESKNKKLIYIYLFFLLSDSLPSLLIYTIKEHQNFAISTQITLLKTNLMLSYVFAFVLKSDMFTHNRPYMEFISVQGIKYDLV